MRLEADELPQRLRAAKPDFVFNMAEGLLGPNREAHVPAICEFLGVPYTAPIRSPWRSPLHKGRAKEILRRPRHPDRAVRRRANAADARNVTLPFPAVREAGPEGSGKG